jgi:hypothetical protein
VPTPSLAFPTLTIKAWIPIHAIQQVLKNAKCVEKLSIYDKQKYIVALLLIFLPYGK